MNASFLLEKSLLHNGMQVGNRAPQATKEPDFPSSQKSVRGKKKRLLILVCAGIICFFASGSASAAEAWVYRKMDELLLIPRQEGYTALNFEYSEDLPNKVAAGDTVSFTFTIKNAQGFDKQYPYDIYVVNAKSPNKIMLDQGTANVKNRESLTVSKSFAFARDYGEETMYVELPESGQKIHFVLNRDEQ